MAGVVGQTEGVKEVIDERRKSSLSLLRFSPPPQAKENVVAKIYNSTGFSWYTALFFPWSVMFPKMLVL